MTETDGSQNGATDKPSDEQFETIPTDEAGEIEETATLTVRLQNIRAQSDETQQGRSLRGVHAKSHGCVKAEFAICDDIEEKYRVGLFAFPGKVHQAWIRFSNAAVLREDDLKANEKGIRQNGSRGMAIKILDVEGEMLSQDEGANNQDFLMINTPEFAFANVRDYLRLSRILENDDMGADPKQYFLPAILAQLGAPQDGEPAQVTSTREFLQGAVAANPLLSELSKDDLLGTIASAKVADKISKQTVHNPLEVQYFGAAPFLFGPDQVMKFSASPRSAVEQQPFPEITDTIPSKNYLREALGQTMQGGKDVCFDFMIQTRNADDEGLNIENATTIWQDELTQYIAVATITIKAPQTPHSNDAQEHCEKLVFTPWHSMAAHRPLGGINRLRRKVYANSADHRLCAGS